MDSQQSYRAESKVGICFLHKPHSTPQKSSQTFWQNGFQNKHSLSFFLISGKGEIHQWGASFFRLFRPYHLKFTSRQSFCPFAYRAKNGFESHLLEPLNDVVISRIFYFFTMHAPKSVHLQHCNRFRRKNSNLSTNENFSKKNRQIGEICTV